MAISSYHDSIVIQGVTRVNYTANLDEMYQPLGDGMTKIADVGIIHNGQDISNYYAGLADGAARGEALANIRASNGSDLNLLFAAYGTNLGSIPNGSLHTPPYNINPTGGSPGDVKSLTITATPPNALSNYTFSWNDPAPTSGTPDSIFINGVYSEHYNITKTTSGIVGDVEGFIRLQIIDNTTGEERLIPINWGIYWDHS